MQSLFRYVNSLNVKNENILFELIEFETKKSERYKE